MILLERETRFGWLVAVSVGGEPGVDALVPEERAIAEKMGPRRVGTFVGGRLSLRRALEKLGVAPGAILTSPRGAPLLPVGVTGSISHKDDIAVAVAAHQRAGEHVGIDLEVDEPLRVDISRRVLREEERPAVEALEGAARDRRVRVTFALKEAIYKAIDPIVARYVAFDEVALDLTDESAPRAILHLDPPAPDFDVSLAFEEMNGPRGERLILAFALARVTRTP